MNDAHSIPQPPSVEELVRSCRNGDERAFRALIEHLLPESMALAVQFVRRREVAEDVVQEAFLRFARALPTYDPSLPFEPWFFTIVRNCARTRVAKTRHRMRREEDHRDHTGGADRVGRDAGDGLSIDLGRAIESLPPMQQRCVRLCLFEGYTSVEAARLLGVREGTVRTHLKRARTRLRSVLDAEVAP